MFLNENNLQAPFQYKISENSFKLEKINNSLQLSKDNSQIKVFEGERLFCVDIGYGINGALEEMEFILDGVRVYPVLLDDINCIRELEEVKENKIYLIKNDINFKSIIFLSVTHLNKQFEYSITAYNTTLSSWMFDYIAKKINSLDTDYPIKNYYNKTNYKANDIIKHNGYLYKVNKDFLSDDSDYYLDSNCSIITPFKSLEIGNSYNAGDILEYKNNFFVVSENFIYSKERDIYNFVKPLIEIINWFDGIKKIYKNQIIVKNGIFYLVLDYVENPVWNNLIRDSKIEILSKASNIFYDDSSTSFGSNTNNLQLAIEKLKKEIDNKIPTGNSNLANNILYDNSKTNLVCETEEYDFPKFKVSIPDTIDITLSNGISDYNGYIVKQSDGNYRLKCNINNFYIDTKEMAIILEIKNINNLNNIYQKLSFLSQFFNIQTVFTTIADLDFSNLEIDECTIYDSNFNLKFAVIYNYYNKSLSLIIIRQDLTVIDSNTYNIVLNIKNRLLRQEDRNIFAFSDPFMVTQDIIDNYIFNLSQNNNNVKLTGSYTIKQGAGLAIGFYSPIIENYFNASISPEWINTEEIISSSGKPIKFSLYKNTIAENNVPEYLFILMHQDDTDLQVGETITFNLTPDKNSVLNKVSKLVENVQELGESLSVSNKELITNISDINKRLMIQPYYMQYTDSNGNFNNNEEPSNWHKKMYGVATTWQIMFNTESVYFRTEGSLASSGRSNGLQGDAIRNITARAGDILCAGVVNAQGAWFYDLINNGSADIPQFNNKRVWLTLDVSRQVPTANENRVKNRLIRIYKLLTINGKKVSDIIGA